MAKIGELLIQRGLITPHQLQQAIEEGRRSGEILGRVLVRLKFVDEEQMLSVLAQQMGLPWQQSLKGCPVSADLIKAVPAKFVWHYKFMPIRLEGQKLTIAVSDPLAVWVAEDLKLHLNFDVERVLTTEDEIISSIRRYYGVGAETVEEILARPSAPVFQAQGVTESVIDSMGATDQDASVIKLVNQLLLESVRSRATDVHLEIFRDHVSVRNRIDGILYDMRVSERIKHLYSAVVSRIKIVAGLNVVEKRLPQDGRSIIKVEDKPIDLRVSVIPSIYGENVVIRILPMHLLFNLDDLGFLPEDRKTIEDLMRRPHGIIFLTGPTGSGKTTTLYACLSQLNRDAVKIITIEDPVEYELAGIMQIQVKPEIGLSFSNCLRSILRHDPDIMMVGEVRDLETAELAIRTSLTGHLIFSTLHTNDAPSGATRLLDIGIEPYLVASSVNAFISQRLVRMICPDCKEEVLNKEFLPEHLRDMPVYRGRGCEKCQFIGYQGRTAIYEILPVRDEIRDLIVRKASSGEIRRKAQELGHRSLLDAGLEKVRAGVTTPQEVMRVAELENGEKNA
jgi:type II secretory ATPase GspE/PulE/Tfp pilus assembly ATPase PilB-like protein